MNDERHYLSTREAAEYLGLSARTLDRYRVSGEGPVFHRFGGRVRYTRADLDAWAKVTELCRSPGARRQTVAARSRSAGIAISPDRARSATGPIFP